MTSTGPLLLNKKFPKWKFESEIWAVPPEGAKGFLETIVESNLTGLVLEASSSDPESTVELKKKIEIIANVNLTSEEMETLESQMWVRGKKDSDDYFSLQNPVSELFLTVESPTETWIADQGKIKTKSLKLLETDISKVFLQRQLWIVNYGSSIIKSKVRQIISVMKT